MHFGPNPAPRQPQYRRLEPVTSIKSHNLKWLSVTEPQNVVFRPSTSSNRRIPFSPLSRERGVDEGEGVGRLVASSSSAATSPSPKPRRGVPQYMRHDDYPPFESCTLDYGA